VSRRAHLVPIDDTTSSAPPNEGECALIVGNFDGVHRGHQAVLRKVAAQAATRGLAASVLTFDPHPAAVVGAGAPPLLTTIERRVELMGQLGVDCAYVRRFDAAFAAWAADRFVRELVAGTLRARIVVVGHDFRFGAKRSGDLSLLRALAEPLHFDVDVHPVASDSGGPFSSTRAREAIAEGDLDEARRVLGRPHELSGPVVHGDHRGRLLGFPTANIAPVPEMLPADGVYAVVVEEVDEQGQARRLGPAVTNIGVRPTVAAGAPRTIETFLLDFSGDLYGRRLRLHLIARLRGERKFGSLDELKAQIAQDVVAARERLAAGIADG
jgi:riboflavin kinase/FMN adenylyltransferase